MLREIEEEIFTELGISFQRIDICTWDLWAPAAKKYDLEAWFPGIDMYKEVTSTSNTTDFQTRRANIKVKTDSWKVFTHSLNGTAVALGRALAAIVENYQTAEGDILVPEVLKPFLSFKQF
jgi:seryl-tRNA synthetase